jgi:hypothetical protein
MSIQEIEKRNCALAVIQVIQMWSHPRYKSFLQCAKPGKLTVEWFNWFAGEWKVARTIKMENRDQVRKYLDQDFRQALLDGGGAETVDDAALHIQRNRWSSQSGKSRKHGLPISLVSKVGFFFRPAKFAPLDNYAVKGLNQLCRSKGAHSPTGKKYCDYLDSFNELYTNLEPRLNSAMQEQWVADLAGKLDCPASALTTVAMRRKLLDDYLMHLGGYRK